MSDNKVDLILHPVRMRILTTIGGRELTAQQLAQRLPDVAQATLYRHISLLHKGGLLAIVDETPVRGTIEKRYALAGPANLTETDITDASKGDHLRFFTTFLATLMGDFTRYVDSQEELHLEQDGVGYHTLPLYLNDEQLTTFAQQLQDIIKPFLEEQPDRKRRLFSFAIMPSVEEE